MMFPAEEEGGDTPPPAPGPDDTTPAPGADDAGGDKPKRSTPHLRVVK
jgi:stringent starvation protein B